MKIHTQLRSRKLQASLFGVLILSLSNVSLYGLSLASETAAKPNVTAAYRSDADLVGYVNLREMRDSQLGQEYANHPLHGKWQHLKESLNLEPSDFQEVAFSISKLDAIKNKEEHKDAVLSSAISLSKPITLEQIEAELAKKQSKDTDKKIQTERTTIDGVPVLQWTRHQHTVAIASVVRDNHTLLAFGTPQAVADIVNNKNQGDLPAFAATAKSGLDTKSQGFVSLQLTDQLKAKIQKAVDRHEKNQAAGIPVPMDLVKNLAQLDVLTTGFSLSDVVQITLAGNFGNDATAAEISQSLEGLLPWLQIMANSKHGHKPRYAHKQKQAKEDGDKPAAPRPHKQNPFVSSFSQGNKGDTTYLNITLTKVAKEQ